MKHWPQKAQKTQEEKKADPSVPFVAIPPLPSFVS
jgi:hypothetical protein